MRRLLNGLNAAAQTVHHNNRKKGFYDKPIEVGTQLMLIVSELSEALEADRKGRHADHEEIDTLENESYSWADSPITYMDTFEKTVKDSHEDEIADAVIRLLDYAGAKGIDLEWHIYHKLEYNKTREPKHGKAY